MDTQETDFEFPEPTNWPVNQIQTLVENIVEILDYKPGDPLTPIVKKLGGVVEYADLRERPEDGSIRVFGPSRFELVLSRFVSDRRNRFTVCHELGHYVLHSKIGKKRIIASRFGTGLVEWEANWFAAAFLMPSKEFNSAVDAKYSNEELAVKFNVSTVAARIRRERI